MKSDLHLYSVIDNISFYEQMVLKNSLSKDKCDYFYYPLKNQSEWFILKKLGNSSAIINEIKLRTKTDGNEYKYYDPINLTFEESFSLYDGDSLHIHFPGIAKSECDYTLILNGYYILK